MLLEYIAGYFDADGSVRAYMQTKTVEVGVEITAVYLPVLQEIQKQFGGTIRMKSDTKGNQRRVWDWFATGQKGRDFLDAIIPYLHEKQEQAILARTIQQRSKQPLQEKLAIAAQIKALKHRNFS